MTDLEILHNYLKFYMASLKFYAASLYPYPSRMD